LFLLPRVSFRCRRFRCSHETAIELKVLVANEKLMFHSYLLEGMDRIAHCAQEREVEDVLSAGTIEEDDNKPGQAITNIALTSLKRLVERQAVIKTGTSRNAVWALNKDRALHRGYRIRFTYFG
jgi:hypothetical protein